MTTRVSEYALSAYRPHAAGSTAGAPFRNGTTYDAGSLAVIDSNISWMVLESPRHLVFCAGPGTTKTTFATNAAVYDGIPNFGPAPSSTTYLKHQEIPWDRRTAFRLGPFHCIPDALAADGTSIPRAINLAIRVTHGVTRLDLYAALTTHGDPRALFDGDYFAFEYSARATPGPNYTSGVPTGTTVAMSLAAETRISSAIADAWKCRRNPSADASLVLVTPLYVWVGWRPVGGAGSASIDSIDAWETRT
jgi:hypothetical protein